MQGDKQRLIIFGLVQEVSIKMGFGQKAFLFRTDKQIKKYLNLPVLSLFQIAVTVRK
ncbi:hypothetical protein Q4S33_08030 [Acinetobacter calcoaceticus]|jgi:hypothetical protein|uniref:hypothetical protein n=1 Tax=Acinetobacter calcoaceticus TaxID=471 RepID=UPI0003805EA9|nr:hypothetical protein [Acinetobacter calcoaceticus]UGQ25610.1 hypothetical protein LRO55_14755 [Acinetobacter calcoaceticus]WNY32354.1 hypothetical protein Q4S33_08030 [Acinetobacter calcoaceticus]